MYGQEPSPFDPPCYTDESPFAPPCYLYEESPFAPPTYGVSDHDIIELEYIESAKTEKAEQEVLEKPEVKFTKREESLTQKETATCIDTEMSDAWTFNEPQKLQVPSGEKTQTSS